jgi:hypothetical protein
MTETEIWTKWESQVVNGIFPLRRFLGRSNHSVVFLTECRAQDLVNAAIKIVPADAARAESRLSRWQLAAALSHPHLIRILETGRCKLGGHPFLFVVTEYAEQNLAQILPHRPLTPAEVQEMLVPTLDALAFLHRQNLVHGQLKAPNFLVVNDQLKLASDTIRTAGDAGGIDLAGDVRGLGATIVEALTQTRPALGSNPNTLSLPPALPAGFADALRRCLSPEVGGSHGGARAYLGSSGCRNAVRGADTPLADTRLADSARVNSGRGAGLRNGFRALAVRALARPRGSTGAGIACGVGREPTVAKRCPPAADRGHDGSATGPLARRTAIRHDNRTATGGGGAPRDSRRLAWRA